MLYPIQNNKRNKLDLSGIWDFKTDPDVIGEKEGWVYGLSESRPMAVPGSWNEQYEDLFGYLDLAWYVKKIYIPSTWRGQRVFIRVGSANYFGTVYVNGEKLGWHEGGHLPFAFEITDHIKWDEENVLAISVENELTPTRVPSGNMESSMGSFTGTPKTTFDFYPFAGIHRPVVLYSVPEVFIEDVTVVTDIEGENGMVKLTVKLNMEISTQGKATIKGDLTQINSELNFKAGIAETTLTVLDAHFWSDKDPFLYDLILTTDEDHYSLKIGIRTVRVEDGKILLNGQPIKMNGFGRHEDFPASGKGLNLPLIVKDYQLMRWTGANAYRTSHYPYSEEEMQMADREGFLIIDEIPAVSLQFDNEENMAERMRMCLQQIDELIRRDKNHPSILMWSVSNEAMPRKIDTANLDNASEEAAMSGDKAFLDKLLNHAKKLDPTRLVTLVLVMGAPRYWMALCDVLCINRYWGWYILGGELDKARTALETELDELWDMWNNPIILTEFGADTIPGYHGHPNLMWTEEYQADFVRCYLEVAEERPFIAGMQVWNFADFAAVQSIGRVGGFNHKGIFTRTRSPKMAAEVLRKFWIG